MNADLEELEELRSSLRGAIAALARLQAPSGIAAYLELGLNRLDAYISMISNWDAERPDET